jgi:cobalt-zinc-cadmium efflux system membrane fusion protein
MKLHCKFAFALPLAMALAACGENKPQEPAKEEATKKDSSLVSLSDEQIGSAGIQITHPTVGGAGRLDLPALIEGDPQGTQVVSAAIGGRVVSLSRNLGQSVQRGAVLAVIESREAAQLNGEVQASRARLALAQSNLAREERLFAQRVSPEQDVIAARTAAAEARIAYAQAAQQVSATGGGEGPQPSEHPCPGLGPDHRAQRGAGADRSRRCRTLPRRQSGAGVAHSQLATG